MSPTQLTEDFEKNVDKMFKEHGGNKIGRLRIVYNESLNDQRGLYDDEPWLELYDNGIVIASTWDYAVNTFREQIDAAHLTSVPLP